MKSKIAKIFLDNAGAFLGRGEGCLIVSDKKRNVEKYPLFENQSNKVGRLSQKLVSVLESYPASIPETWEKVTYDTGLVKRGRSILLGGD